MLTKEQRTTIAQWFANTLTELLEEPSDSLEYTLNALKRNPIFQHPNGIPGADLNTAAMVQEAKSYLDALLNNYAAIGGDLTKLDDLMSRTDEKLGYDADPSIAAGAGDRALATGGSAQASAPVISDKAMGFFGTTPSVTPPPSAPLTERLVQLPKVLVVNRDVPISAKEGKPHAYKFMFLGNSDAGKTGFMLALTEQQHSGPPVIGIDYKVVRDLEKNTEYQLWDTAGQERFTHLIGSFLRGANACLIMGMTFANVKRFADLLENAEGASSRDLYNIDYVVSATGALTPVLTRYSEEKLRTAFAPEAIAATEASVAKETGLSIMRQAKEMSPTSAAANVAGEERNEDDDAGPRPGGSCSIQ